MNQVGLEKRSKNVCPWGDPVNTSSKLGQDLAKDGDLLVMPIIHEKSKNSRYYPYLDFEERMLKRSKVDFKCYCVTMEPLPILAPNIAFSYEKHHVAILVSDLSGFTSTTRKWGIVHMASIIVRMRQLCLPCLTRRGAIYITTEADNFICIFADTVQAVLAGLEMQAVLDAYKESLSKEREHFKVKLNGVGVHCGKGVLLDKL